MLDPPDSGPPRQKAVEVASPARRVFPSAITSHSCPIENGLDPPAKAIGRLRPIPPHGLDDLHHQPDIYSLHRHRTEDRKGVGRQCLYPLRRVLLAPPTRPVRRDIRVSAGLEGY